MKEPVRILHVLGGVSLGGAESRIMDLYRNMDRNGIQFDFLIHSDSGKERKPEFYEEEIQKLGGRLYVLPKFKLYNYFSYLRAVKQFFHAHREFAVVQGHMTSTASIYLPVAKKSGIPLVAAHARSAGVDRGPKGILTKWLRRPLLKRADYCLACSREAGQAVFGRAWEQSGKAFVIPNAIEAGKYIYNDRIRKEIRDTLKIEGCYVLGHVGRFHYAKNHEFLLEIFSEVRKKMEPAGTRAVLMLLGEGSGMEDIRRKAQELDIAEDVLFMGNKTDVENYYQAMDYFVFPSRFEGLPGTVAEAQAAGLRCIISDRITKEAGFSSLVYYESIDAPAAAWAEYIAGHAYYERKNMEQTVKRAGFDVREQAALMTEFYNTGHFPPGHHIPVQRTGHSSDTEPERRQS